MSAPTFEGKGKLEREEILSFHTLNFSALLTTVSKNMHFFSKKEKYFDFSYTEKFKKQYANLGQLSGDHGK